MAVRAHVRPDGTVERTEYTADSLVPAPGGEDANPTEIRDAIMLEIAGTLMDATFPRRRNHPSSPSPSSSTDAEETEKETECGRGASRRWRGYRKTVLS